MEVKEKRKYTHYATPEKMAQVNETNIKHVERYFNAKAMNLSDSSRKSYLSDFNQWLVFIMERWDNQDVLKMDEVDVVDMLEDYVSFCSNQLGNNERRIQRRLSSISSFYLSYQKKRKIDTNPLSYIERPKVGKGEKPQIQQNFLSEEQVEAIRQGLEEIDDVQLSLFFEFGLSTMARANAIANVKIAQIDLENRRVDRVIEKEGYEVVLFFSKQCLALLNKWLEYRKEQNIDCEYLFISKYKGNWDKIKKGTLQTSWIKRIGMLIGIPNLHCHDLRHSGSNLLYHKGMKLEDVSKLLNHKGTQVTQDHYLRIDYNKIADEKDKYEV